jgi:GNAT superfamily N-acetyltransferase
MTFSRLVLVRTIQKPDFDRIVEVIDHWWGGPISTFAHPIFFYELGRHAMVVEKDGEMVGFLLGFVATEPAPTGYVHLVGIHPAHRRQGVGRLLYERFTEACAAAGCRRMKAITTTGNEGSIRFHVAQGWTAQEVEDYAGPGRKRVVFTRDLG